VPSWRRFGEIIVETRRWTVITLVEVIYDIFDECAQLEKWKIIPSVFRISEYFKYDDGYVIKKRFSG